MSFGFGLSFPAWLVLSGSGGAPFSPLSLFSSGEQGAWYDPSDTATLFQDSAGVTPVTAVEQPVGLILDKSKGLVLGSELVTNGDFSGGTTGWTAGAGVTISGGVADFNVASFAGLVSVGSLAAGRAYKVSITISNFTSGSLLIYGSGGAVSARFLPPTSNGTHVGYIVASGAGNIQIIGNPSFVGTVDNISVRELPGNHAYQTDSAKRPLWSSRVNLLQRTEEFNDAAWSIARSTRTADAINSPLGTLTADKIETNSTHPSSAGGVTQTITIPAGATLRLSVSLKAGNATWATLTVDDNANVNIGRIWFDIVNGAVGTTSTVGSGFVASSGAVEPQNDDWFRCSATFTTSTVTTIRVFFYCAQDGNGSTASTLGNFAYIWGADLRVANESSALPPYQRVVTATDYDTTGFVPFLRFDGSNDALVTNSIDFTATDEMSVFAGVRKLAGGSYPMILETSVDAGTNAGAFFLAVVGNGYEYRTGGLSRVPVAVTANFDAPRTNVMTGLGNISGDSATLRIDAAQAAQSTADQSTGNFGNYPLYIGSRAGTSLPYNGRLHSLIVLGRTVTATELTQTEGYVEAKTFGKDMNYVYSVPLNGPDGNQLLVTAGGDPLFMNVNYE